MPRRKREERYLCLECVQCNSQFDAVREDAKTCSARCRVAFSRDRKASAKAAKRKAFTLCLTMVCKMCGTTYDAIQTFKCPTCGALECRSATNDEHLAFVRPGDGQEQLAQAATA